MRHFLIAGGCLLSLAAGFSLVGNAQEESSVGEPSQPHDAAAEVLAGHSYHGEAFNEGPRQKAYLMEGLGRVQFPVTTKSTDSQAFITQGVAQLHGFWYFEAERSFRQAATFDPDCAMAYWGMAMANQNNEKRAKEFIAEASSRTESVSKREEMYVDALEAYLKADSDKKKERGEKYARAFEKILYEFPDDVEAKALLVLQLWKNRSDGVPIASYLAVNAILNEILDVEPMHPVHHYRIHLWDYERPVKALEAATRCGQSLPAIAHMWHMPGHTFSRVKRYDDAAWQQEASARVDHAHMMRDRIMPDQIHNFAHNNEWLIRNLNHIGRVHDAIDLARNMIELPRHPKYNTLSKRGSAQYGRTRLFETLYAYEMWDELIANCNSTYLEPTDSDEEQIKRLRLLASAQARSGDRKSADTHLASLRERLADQQQKRDDAVSAAEEQAREKAVNENEVEKAAEAAATEANTAEPAKEQVKQAGETAEAEAPDKQLADEQKDIEKAGQAAAKPFESLIRKLEQAIAEVEGHLAADAGDNEEALKKLKEATGVEAILLAELQLQSGNKEGALKRARKHVKSNENEVLPLARCIELLWQAELREEAAEKFATLREQSHAIDIDAPAFARLAPIAAELGFADDWRIEKSPGTDVGDRPDLDSLGPFRWQPSPAPEFELVDSEGKTYSLKQFQGQPVVVIFYLGYGCLHCAEQLQTFAPKSSEFYDADIQLLAISTDDADGLQLSMAAYDGGPLPFPLLSDSNLDVFRAYRAYDGFEDQPLHGTFLIDADGLIRWQDISYEPFMEPGFLLKEARRLIQQ